MPTCAFQEQGTVTEPRCQKNVVARVTQAARVCWMVGHVDLRVTSSSPLSRASSARAPLDHVGR